MKKTRHTKRKTFAAYAKNNLPIIVEKSIRGGYVMQYIDMQKQIISIWKITINALNQYFLCI